MLLAVVMPMKLWAADGNPEPYAVLTGDTNSFAEKVRHAVRNTFITKRLVNLFIKNMSAHDENASQN